MGDLELARVRRQELLREAEEGRFGRASRERRLGSGDGRREGGERVGVRWGLAGDEAAVADLLQLNGMPRWVAFEEQFVVAEEDGKIVGALRYRTEKERLVLGLLVVDPWAGEEWLARALYAGAADLARETGAGEVVAAAPRTGYPGLAGYRRRGRDWRLVVVPTLDEPVADGWRRLLELFGAPAVPFVGLLRRQG